MTNDITDKFQSRDSHRNLKLLHMMLDFVSLTVLLVHFSSEKYYFKERKIETKVTDKGANTDSLT